MSTSSSFLSNTSTRRGVGAHVHVRHFTFVRVRTGVERDGKLATRHAVAI